MSTPEVRNNRTEVEGVDFTPTAQSQAEPSEQPVVGAAPASSGKMHWVTRAAYAISTVAFVGLLVALLGAYIVRQDAVIVAGTIIIASAATAWVVGTVILFALIAGPLFSAFRRILQPRRLR